jgi:hypothetical protein
MQIIQSKESVVQTIQNGAVIHQARTLYNSIYRDQFTVFNDDCVGSSAGLRPVNNAEVSNNFEAKVFPNPTNNGFDIKSNCHEDCEVEIKVTNLLGQVLLRKHCNLLEGNCFINQSFSAGTYLVSIIKIKTNEKAINKLVVIH